MKNWRPLGHRANLLELFETCRVEHPGEIGMALGKGLEALAQEIGILLGKARGVGKTDEAGLYDFFAFRVTSTALKLGEGGKRLFFGIQRAFHQTRKLMSEVEQGLR